MSCPVRKYPLRQPKNHVPPIPRWTLQLPDTIDRVFTAYLGVQCHSQADDNINPATSPTNSPLSSSSSSLSNRGTAAAEKAVSAVEEWLSHPSDQPLSFERFTVREGFDVLETSVWVAYWASADSYKSSLARLNLREIYNNLGKGKESVGLWCERFETAVSRLETNYTGTDYLPGLGEFVSKLPDTTTYEHKLTAYWGAARDRIPDSGHDLFEKAAPEIVAPPKDIPAGLGQRLTGSNYENLTHIRSGQFWERCPPDERDAYENKLERTLLEGLGYLWSNPLDTGTIGLRFLRNEPPPDSQHDKVVLKETCGVGFFRSLGDLEYWSKRHPSHLAIFNGAMRHAKEFGPGRGLRTWHEVSVLKEGEAYFEYLNCTPETGAIRFVALEKSSI